MNEPRTPRGDRSTLQRTHLYYRSPIIGCAGLDLILDQRGADMADLPGAASGMLCRNYKGKEPIGW
jgi:hypothetical protein